MLILEIAAGVILGGLALRFLQLIPTRILMRHTLALSVWAAVLAVLVALGIWGWRFEDFRLALAVFGVLIAFLPSLWIYVFLQQKYAVLNGKPPYDGGVKQLLRFPASVLLALALIAFGLLIIFVISSVFEFFFPGVS